MDRRERWEDQQEALRAALEGWQKKIWTAAPGIVQSFDPAEGTVSVQPAIMAEITDSAGKTTSTPITVLIHCPVIIIGGGGFSITTPIAKNDEALVIFANRCIDGWWQSGGVQKQIEYRLHDISDGFALVGPRNKRRTLAGYSATSLQLRSDDGATVIEVAPAGVVNITCATANITASSRVNLGGAGGAAVARIGDFVTTDFGDGVIRTGSSKVFSQ